MYVFVTLILHFSVKGNYTVTVKFESFGKQKLETLPITVGVLDFFIVNKPMFALLNFEQTFQVILYSVGVNPSETVMMGFDPGERELIFTGDESSKLETVTFDTAGEKHLTATTTYMSITEVSEYTVTVFRGCVSTADLFQVEHRVPSNPMDVLISAVPTVSGRAVRDDCNETELHVYKWEMWRDTGSPPSYSWEPVNIQQPQGNSLVLSKYILEPGLYRVWLEVSVTNSVERVSDTIHISASLPSIVAEVSGGGSLQEAVIGKPHVLDAEASSYDPARAELDQSTLGPSSLSYSWTCYKLDTEDLVARYTAPFSVDTSYRALPTCVETGALPQQGLVTLDTALFSPEYLALFEVHVSSNIGGRHSTAVTALKMVAGGRPSLTIQ